MKRNDFLAFGLDQSGKQHAYLITSWPAISWSIIFKLADHILSQSIPSLLITFLVCHFLVLVDQFLTHQLHSQTTTFLVGYFLANQPHAFLADHFLVLADHIRQSTMLLAARLRSCMVVPLGPNTFGQMVSRSLHHTLALLGDQWL